MLREIFVQGLLAVILTIPIYPLIRWALRPALVDDLAVLGARSPITRGASRREQGARAPHQARRGGLA